MADHAPLERAIQQVSACGPVVPLYIHEDHLIGGPFASRMHQKFVWECLDELDLDLQSIGGSLSEYHAEPVELFERIHRKVGITAIRAYAETTDEADYRRDIEVRTWAKARGVLMDECSQDNVTRGTQGAPKLSFQAYLDRAVQQPLPNLLAQSWGHCFNPRSWKVDRNTLPRSPGEDAPKRLRGGRSGAKAAAAHFFERTTLKAYPYSLSSPLRAIQGCSRLSPYLAHGVVSDRQVLHRLNQAVSDAHAQLTPDEFAKLQSAAAFFAERLQWRQAYFQSFESDCTPHQLNRIEGLEASRQAEYCPRRWQAFCEGRTGFPFVDAVIAHLKATGWINFRARAMLASFATMQLWLPAEAVARQLAHWFLDYHPGIHFPQMAIASGHGWGPDLLIYDAIKQGLDKDPQGVFTKRWLPEVRTVPAVHVHTPWVLGDAAPPAYPPPIVDHALTLQLAKSRVAAFRKAHQQAS